MGPNVRKLICHKISLLAVSPNGGMQDALNALTQPGRLLALAREATNWVNAAILAVKSAKDNHFGDDDEAIAAAILKGVDDLKSKRKAT